MAAPVVLVEAHPRDPATGAPVVVRLAGSGAHVPYIYGGEHWRAGITALPASIASLDFDGEQIGGGGVAQAIELSWSPASGTALSELASLFWTDASIVVRCGPEDATLALPAIVTSGLVLETAVESGTMRIALADQAADLKRALLTDRFAATGGIEGPPEFDGVIKSRAWGRCFNVPGRLLDKAHQIWCFGDPRRPWQAFDQVRDKGVAASPATISQLDWQGSAEATFAALQAAQADDGGGVVCPSLACVKWWTEPAGDLHADIRGEIAGGYVETAPEIAARIVAARSTLGFAAGGIATAVAWRPAVCGWRVDSEGTTAAAAVSELLGGVALSWLIVDDAIELRRWQWAAATRHARSEDVTRRRTYKPVASRKLGYRRNWAPMARGDLAAVVLEGTYADGTPYEALKPAQPGATAGAPAGSIVGGVVQPDGSVTGGEDAGDVVHALSVNVNAIIENALRQDDVVTYINAIALVEGQPVGTVFLNFRNDQQTADAAVASTFALIGAKNSNGTAFDLALDTVRVSPTQTLGQRLTEISAQAGEASASVTDLQEALVDANGGYARASQIVAADGSTAGYTSYAGGGGTAQFVMVGQKIGLATNASGANYAALIAHDGTKWVFGSQLYVQSLVDGAVATEKLADSATAQTVYALLGSSVTCGANATQTVFSVQFTKDRTASLLRVITFLQASDVDDLQFTAQIAVAGNGVNASRSCRVNLTFTGGASAAETPITPFAHFPDVPAGTYTVSVTITNMESSGDTLTVAAGSAIEITELKKGSL